jgi:hypothetical protein
MRKMSVKSQQDELRDQMMAAGTGTDLIAAEFACRYGMRPRTAWRRAHGWVLSRAADHISREAYAAGLHPAGRTVAMSGVRLCEHEAWPGPGRRLTGLKPTPYVLALLARTYGTAIPCLLDTHDYKELPPRDLLVIEAMQSDPMAAYSRGSYPAELTSELPDSGSTRRARQAVR